MKLLPVLKEKKRYITCKVYAEDSLKTADFNTILLQIKQLLGVFDAASAGIRYVKYDLNKQTCIIRVNHKYTQKARACLLLINNINNKKIMIRPLITSGILKKAKQVM